jgi:UDP-N-acetylglucosamine diphosphorylase / glucose-1-phosphate thymidylyltransferase / UDP-N-acetylgalactosamine diphosphorylase / glucosamine-1-phosphate N-acetyltransferase / galactosamine-1-phosphate N-acetyltransferase
MQICIFEGINYEQLEPLSFPRPVYNLISGITNLKNKILRSYPGTKYSFHCRPYLSPFLSTKYPDANVNTIIDDRCLFLNGRLLAPDNLAEIIPLDGEDKIYMNNETIVAARVSNKKKLDEIKIHMRDVLTEGDFDGLPVEKVDIKTINFVHELMSLNGQELIRDFNYYIRCTDRHKKMIKGKVYEGAHLIEKDNIYIEEGAVLKPGSVLDASSGPIFIDRNAQIFPNAVIEGPGYIGEETKVKSGATIYENVSIGKTCKVGGEIEDVVMFPYSNKQHSGFLGHAYIGSWVNIGADTNCSDLKNNYGSVRFYNNGEMIDSGLQFLGLIMGDHSKTAINSMFNTGTIVGFSCNIFGAGFPSKYIPSFSWGGADAITTYDIHKSIETAKRVISRRNKEMMEPEEKLFLKIFDLTQKERRKRGYPY